MNLSNGSIVSLSHDGRQRLALVEHIPKNKASMVRIVLDPGKKGGYEAIPVDRALLTVVPESDATRLARIRIKAKQDSGGGLAELNRRSRVDSRNMYEGDQGGTGGRGAPQRSQVPTVLSKNRGGYKDWSSDLERYLCGGPYQFAKARLKERYPQLHQVWRLHVDIGMSMAQIADSLNLSIPAVKQRKYRARLHMVSLFREWHRSEEDGRVA